jgi:Polyprenyltransferase (cytochrome oxidase assembly factor)
VLLGGAHRLHARTKQGGNAKAAMQLFHLSNSYLAFVFVAVAVDTLLR